MCKRDVTERTAPVVVPLSEAARSESSKVVLQRLRLGLTLEIEIYMTARPYIIVLRSKEEAYMGLMTIALPYKRLFRGALNVYPDLSGS